MAIAAIASIVVNKLDDMLREEPRVRNEVESITAELQVIRRYAASKEHTEQISTWLDGAKKLVFETEDILDTFILWKEQRRKQNNLVKYTFFIQSRYKLLHLLHKLKTIQTKIVKTSEARLPHHIELLEDRNETSSFKNERHTYSFIREDDIIGLEDDAELLVSRLIDEDGRRVISIFGMGGLGKTTLAKAVYNNMLVEHHFEIRCWIYVSQDYREREIVNHILKSITGDREDILTIDQSLERLYNLLMGKRYLFVLDDVWDAEPWQTIGAFLPDTGVGSKVLLTTRNRNVASSIDPDPHVMKYLNAENSWKLLLKIVGRPETISPELMEIGKKIANKCGGLPLAIQVVGGFLWRIDRTLNEWSMLLNKVSLYPNAGENSFLSILELSYYDLPFHLMPLYLYLLFFPKEYEIPLRRIFGLWLAEGFIIGERRIPQEELAQVYLQELIARNLIQVVKWKLDGKPKTCRLAGLLRDVLLPRAHEMGLFQIQKTIDPGTSLATPTSAVRHLVEYIDIKDYSSLECFIQNSRSYISFNFRKGDSPAEVTGQFLGRVIQNRSFRLLGVLDLERVYKPKLPDSLGKLHVLKYLGLRWTFLDAIPSSVGNLQNLETLDVKHTHIIRLPNSIWKMKNLRHLYLNEIHLDMIEGDIALNNLQTLWGLSAGMESPIKDNLDSLITLQKLGLTVQHTLVEVYAKWISRLTALRILRFRSRDECGRPSDLKLGSFSSLVHLCDLYLLGRLSTPLDTLQLPKSLTVLTLSVSGLEQDPMPMLELLPKLSALRLFAHSYTGKTMVCSSRGFPFLSILKLWMLEELEEWIIEEGAMSSLTQLEIRCCKSLKICPTNMLQLPLLRDLILTNMSTDFVSEVKAEKGNDVSLTLNSWEFPTFSVSFSPHYSPGTMLISFHILPDFDWLVQ